MASGLKDWWRKLNEVTFFEREDAFYMRLSNLRLAVIAFGVAGSTFAFISPWFRGVVQNRWLTLLLILSASVALGWLVYEIWRRRSRSTLLARVNAETLTLALLGSWPSKIEVPLSTLRSVSIMLPPPSMFSDAKICSICLAFNDGQEKTVKALYEPQVGAAVSDFLQRKLPPSVTFTAWGRTALENA